MVEMAKGGEFPHHHRFTRNQRCNPFRRLSDLQVFEGRFHVVTTETRTAMNPLPVYRQGVTLGACAFSLTKLCRHAIAFSSKKVFAMLKLSEILEPIGASRADLTNWFTRLQLRTTYAPTAAGSARYYTKENVLELALINAYVRVGVHPQAAVAMSDMTLRAVASGARVREWAVFASGNFSTGRMADTLDEISFDGLTADQPDDVPVFAVVRIGEIVRRVEALFKAKEQSDAQG
jgi:hypothetical protein